MPALVLVGGPADLLRVAYPGDQAPDRYTIKTRNGKSIESFYYERVFTSSRAVHYYELRGQELSKPVELDAGHGLAANDKGKRATRLPPDFEPSQATWETALHLADKAGMPTGFATEELAKFVDYWHSKPGKSATKIDWNRAFLNWIRNGIQYQKRHHEKHTGTQRTTADDYLDSVIGGTPEDPSD